MAKASVPFTKAGCGFVVVVVVVFGPPVCIGARTFAAGLKYRENPIAGCKFCAPSAQTGKGKVPFSGWKLCRLKGVQKSV